ncbi:MAG TPA: N-acetylmuramoyl-L-alanine amidase [Bacteriovoracaceae bacterium]|nr:N-acetylmuramoyl-L-alanine amidase [Bacteriovoracaceae bacterium]
MKFFAFLLFFILTTAQATVVLVDPGHGGEELGAVAKLRGKNIFEKDLSLRLSTKIRERLSKKTSTFLTRSLDRTVSLQERADLADLVKADLFLSIHFNSSSNPRSNGFELYYLDNKSNAATQKVEKLENISLKGEELIINQILLDLVIQQTVSHSKKLASDVHSQVRPVLKKYKIADRGIKPGLFYVLALSKRPGLLIEVGFMSNPNELKKINSEKFLDEMALAIADGVFDYIRMKK